MLCHCDVNHFRKIIILIFFILRYYHFGIEKDDVISKCDNCKEEGQRKYVTNCPPADDVLNNDTISGKVSRISLEECVNLDTPWCTKCKNNILKLEDTMPGISKIVPTSNLNKAEGRAW